MWSYQGSFRNSDEPVPRAEDHEDLHSPFATIYHGQASQPQRTYDNPGHSHRSSSSKQHRSSLKGKERAEARKFKERARNAIWEVPLDAKVADRDPKYGKTVPPVDANVEDWREGPAPAGYKVVWYNNSKIRVSYFFDDPPATEYYDDTGNRCNGTGVYDDQGIEYVDLDSNNMDLVQQAQYGPTDYDESVQGWQWSQGSNGYSS